MNATSFVLAAVALVLVASLARMAYEDVSRDRDEARRTAFVVAFVVLGSFAVRALLVSPSFVHANFHAIALTDTILGFPEAVSHRQTYGQFGFFALGVIAAAFGRTFDTVCAANELFSALTVAVAGLIARRFTGSRVAAVVAVAIAATHPGLLRIAASEDVHTLALLLGFVGIWALDRHLIDGRRASLVAAASALVLMVNTRQTFYPYLPVVFCLALGRGGVALFRRPSLWVAGLVVLAASVLRVATSVGDGGDQTTFRALPILLTTPAVLKELVRYHPALDVVRFGPVMPALIWLGVWRSLAGRGVTMALGISFLGLFVLTFPFGFGTPGVEFGFRMPMLGLSVLVAGVGGAWLADRFGARVPVGVVRPVTFALAAALAFLPVVTPSWRSMREVSADLVEYRFLSTAAKALPAGAQVVVLRANDPMPAYKLSERTLRLAGVTSFVDSDRLAEADRGRPLFFLVGVQCWSYSLGELMGSDPKNPVAVGPTFEKYAPVTFGRVVDSPLLEPPAGLRPECAALLTGATPFGPSTTIEQPLQDIPFVLYRHAPLEIRFYKL